MTSLVEVDLLGGGTHTCGCSTRQVCLWFVRASRYVTQRVSELMQFLTIRLTRAALLAALITGGALGCDKPAPTDNSGESSGASAERGARDDGFPAGMHCDMRRGMGICFEYAEAHPLSKVALSEGDTAQQVRGILCMDGKFAPGSCPSSGRISVCDVTDTKRHHLYSARFDAAQAASYCDIDSSSVAATEAPAGKDKPTE